MAARAVIVPAVPIKTVLFFKDFIKRSALDVIFFDTSSTILFKSSIEGGSFFMYLSAR